MAFTAVRERNTKVSGYESIQRGLLQDTPSQKYIELKVAYPLIR